MGKSIVSLGFSERLRVIYLSLAKGFVERLPSELVEAAWVRRSAANEDFLPVVSDIDVTILIDDRNLRALATGAPLPRPRLIQDIQFVSKRFLRAFEETGGFRNYQSPQWRQIFGIPMKLGFPHSGKEERAFEVAYEVHLIYKQIAAKIAAPRFNSRATARDLEKLGRELNRLRLFWETGENLWAVRPRDQIPSPGTLAEVLLLLEQFCRSLIQELEPPLNVYDWRTTVTQETELFFETAISFKGQQICVLRDPTKILEARRKKDSVFFASASYLQMIKGIGVQEQDQLNRLARDNAYYRRFSAQRLAHDLIGALILEPEDLENLYYCFFNIARFIEALTGECPTKWAEIESVWDSQRKIPWAQEELLGVSTSYLDLLEALI